MATWNHLITCSVVCKTLICGAILTSQFSSPVKCSWCRRQRLGYPILLSSGRNPSHIWLENWRTRVRRLLAGTTSSFVSIDADSRKTVSASVAAIAIYVVCFPCTFFVYYVGRRRWDCLAVATWRNSAFAWWQFFTTVLGFGKLHVFFFDSFLTLFFLWALNEVRK